MKEIIVNVDKDKNKTIILLENGIMLEKYNENVDNHRLEGNIYLGKVQNVLKGMQAAFVDIGEDHGYCSDCADYYFSAGTAQSVGTVRQPEPDFGYPGF